MTRRDWIIATVAFCLFLYALLPNLPDAFQAVADLI